MMMSPLLLTPLAKKNCLLLSNKLYCEETTIKSDDLGIFLIIVAAIIFWIILSVWISDKIFNNNLLAAFTMNIFLIFVIPGLVFYIL